VIARNVLNLLTDAANYFNESNKINILVLANELLLAKPNMAAPTNILKIFINEFPKLSAKKEIANFLKNLESDMYRASDKCINLTIEKLFKKENTSILTCSYSSNVFNIIACAGIDLNVYVIQSIWNDIDFSAIWLDKLKVLKVKCNVILIDDNLPKIDFALIGADAVLYSGDIINGTPSLYLAQSINKIGLPLFVVAESFKKCKEIQIADGFELIPKEFITEIITDNITKNFKSD